MRAKLCLALAVVLAVQLLTACQPRQQADVDRLNALAYAYHYRDLDSTEYYAEKALRLAADYSDGKAEALNHIAFASIMRMRYVEADSLLLRIYQTTDNEVELLVADVQMMRLCQRQSYNREFYDCRERALARFRRINEDRSQLDDHLQRRMLYAETEYAIVSSTYYYYIGLETESRQEMEPLSQTNEIMEDTAQWLNYLYNVGSGGLVVAQSQEEVNQREFEMLMRCFQLARQYDYPFWAANSLEAIADHLAQPDTRQQLLRDNLPSLQFINPDGVADEELPVWLADAALSIFERYGDVYQIAGAYRTLASCYRAKGDYESTLYNLEQALADTTINQAPDLVASISEQLSVAYAAVDNKQASDYWRNLYFDVQASTRQDRYLEARADRYDREARVLNRWIAVVVAAIVLLLLLILLLYRLNKKKTNNIDSLLEPLLEWDKTNEKQTQLLVERLEEIEAERELSQAHVEKSERLNLENRAKVSLVVSIVPLIERMVHSLKRLASGKTENRDELLEYVAELTDKIDEDNRLLTHWIQLRQGQLNLRIESFPLQDLFDIVGKGRTAFALKGITFDVEPTDAMVKADRILTLFMINTLADNARKFTPEGGRVNITAEEAADYVEISVADTGCGMSQEQLSGIFDHKIYNGHGFGLMNCKGIIEKCKKVSQIFSVCELKAESEEGSGSRFFFRLPKGVRRAIVALIALIGFAGNAQAISLTDQAGIYLDSAYFCNVYGHYQRALLYTDSCRECLNKHYQKVYPKGTLLLQRLGDSSLEAPEVRWFKDSVKMNYNLILDFRNEAAVAALALHEWELYNYNNRVSTALYKEMSADNTLPEYCRRMQQSQTNKTVAIVLLILLLLLIPPLWYLLYYRHRLYYRDSVEKVNAINQLLLSEESDDEKLRRIEKLSRTGFAPELEAIVNKIEQTLREKLKQRTLQMADIEQAEDECRRVQLEEGQLHVSNSVLDNCLSTLKHETMYYPSRIRQLIDQPTTDVNTLTELATYYRDIYALLSEQASRQVDEVKSHVGVVSLGQFVETAEPVSVECDQRAMNYLFDILKKQNNGKRPQLSLSSDDKLSAAGYLRLNATMDTLKLTSDQCANLFTPSIDNIPYLLCRQIIRDLSETTNRRGCGIQAKQGEQGEVVVQITLPVKRKL